ncbi:MAG TPA: DUF3696 domain-containing protein [Blastocatellia bacterium]
MNSLHVRWRNFHGFEDTAWLTIKPLTVILGANNSGKTSLLAPLLLMKQSLLSTDHTLALLTRGDLTNLGSYDDLIYNHEANRDLAIGVRFDSSEDHESEEEGEVGDHPPDECDLTFMAHPNQRDILLRKYEIRDRFGRSLITRTSLANGKYSLKNHCPAVPEKKSAKKARNGFEKILQEKIKDAKPVYFLFTDKPLREALIEGREGRKNRPGVVLSPGSTLYLRATGYVSSKFHELFLHNLGYIGPLRERPKRFYEMEQEMPGEAGPRGEAVPHMLCRGRASHSLTEVNRWVSFFEFGVGIECKEQPEGFSVYLKRSEAAPLVNFADTGFGMSQLLPLIVQGVYSEKGTYLIGEQPEIHLNPRLQARLADLFVHRASTGRGLIVETHSEHLLLRLRRLVAEGKFSADDVALYYVEKTAQTSVVRPVPISSNGHIETSDWPRGFFSESISDALALATAQAKGKNG